MTSVDICTLTNLFECEVRSFLNYACKIYSLHHANLIDFIDNVHRRFKKRHVGLYNYSYCDRLKLCNFEILKLRRM